MVLVCMDKGCFIKWSNKSIIVLTLLLLFFLLPVSAQKKIQVTKKSGLFREVCWVYYNDTSVRTGFSTKYYKGNVIEKGLYDKNKKVGKWRFYNLNNILEYEYDFGSEELILMSGSDQLDLRLYSPCLFKGSPLIPYLHIVNELGYPQKAINEDIEGKVVLALKVNNEGRVYGFYIAEKLHPTIDKAVIEVAKKMPSDWRFIAATKKGKAINGEYHIAIEFYLE